MKIEIATGFKSGEIAYASGTLVDQIAKTHIEGTQKWPFIKDLWMDQIRGIRRYSFDLRAEGLRVGYRGYLENFRHMDRRGISILLDEPKIVVFADEEQLSPMQLINISEVMSDVAKGYYLKTQDTPPGLIFPKEIYASSVGMFDSIDLNIH